MNPCAPGADRTWPGLRAAAMFLMLAGVLGPLQLGGAGDEDETPEHPQAWIEVVRLRGDAPTACGTDLRIAFGREATFSCGAPGAVTRITWKFLGQSESGDRYVFTRTMPSTGGGSSVTSTRDVVYAGEEIVIWEDSDQRILIRPKAAHESGR